MPGLPRLAAMTLPAAALAVGALTSGALLVPDAGAQGSATLRGVAFDSVAMKPLSAAFVSLGGAQSTFSDSLGRFQFADVATGTHLIEMTHARLDSMGLPGVSLRIRVDADRAPITIAIPSFATLWRAACGDRMAPDDSGFVYGTIRRAVDGGAAPGAVVEVSWVDLSVDKAVRVSQKRYRAEIESDERGEFAVCGVPLDAGLRAGAKLGDDASAELDLGGAALRVIRRDFLVGPTDTSAATLRGMLVGIALDAAGRPFAGASVVLDGGLPQRTLRDGRFSFAGVLPGTRQLEFFAIGVKPQVVIVDVMAGQRTETTARMERITTLGAVRITSSHWQQRMMNELADRMAKGHGQYRDATQLGKRASIEDIFAGVRGIQGFTRSGRSTQASTLWMGISVQRRCQPTLYIDGYQESNTDRFNMLRPQDIAMMEVYDVAYLVPYPFSLINPNCGAIVIWTKDVMP
jgi:hypothetical protein